MAWNLFDFSFILFTMMSLEFGRIRLPAACSSVVVKKMYKKRLSSFGVMWGESSHLNVSRCRILGALPQLRLNRDQITSPKRTCEPISFC